MTIKNTTITGLAGFIAFILIFIIQTPFTFAAENPESLSKSGYERVVAHGGGAYQGYETSNSVEALNQAILNGYKLIELDMDVSSDHKIIMIHDWDRTTVNYYDTVFQHKISQNKFQNLSVYGKFEVLTFEKLGEILKQHPDVRVVTDTKGDNLELLTILSEDFPDLVNRMIPQIYDYDQYGNVKELGFTDIIFTLYAMPDIDTEKLICFVKDHPVYAVTMPDYLAEKGTCAEVARAGIPVYVHPVSEFEDAQRFLKFGAYGVYTGTLLPEEFDGFEKDYYLTVKDAGGIAVKLTDDRISSLNDLQVHGLQPGETVVFLVDARVTSMQDLNLSEIKRGKHSLELCVYRGKEAVGSMDYLLWKDSAGLRVLHKKYEYRLDESKQQKDFEAVMAEELISSEISGILKNSFIARKNDYAFYSNGKAESFMNGEEYLPVQTAGYGRLMLPLSTTARRLGADSVEMDSSRDISVLYHGEQNLVMVGSYMIRKGFQITKIKNPVTLYLNKAMAGGEFYQCITGRNYIEKDGMIIILPYGIDPDSKQREQLLESAGKLYQFRAVK